MPETISTETGMPERPERKPHPHEKVQKLRAQLDRLGFAGAGIVLIGEELTITIQGGEIDKLEDQLKK